MPNTKLNQLIEQSLTGPYQEQDCKLKLDVNGETWDAYSVSVSNRDLLFYCEQGTCTYLVDSYGDRSTIELFDWSKDE